MMRSARISEENNLTASVGFYLLGLQKSSQYIILILFSVLLIVYLGTICGNLLIVILVSTSKNLHTPMYFFLTQLSISDIMLTTNIVPNMFHILLNNGGAITFVGCLTQLFFFGVSEIFECVLLTVMSIDRYMAICNPLRYTSIMTRTCCVVLAIMCWVLGSLMSFVYTITLSVMSFCGHNQIDHLYCDLVPLVEIACSSTYVIELEVYVVCFLVLFLPIIIIVISYINILVTILRFQSRISRRKAFSTCSSHLIVVSNFYITLLSVYLFPKSAQNLNLTKLTSLLYTVFTPLINPIIYSLRNKEIKSAFQELVHKCKRDAITPK